MFLILIGDEKGIYIDYAQKDLYGSTWKTREADNLFDTSTENAPFVP